MDIMNPSAADLIVTAPNGVAWKSQPGGSSSTEEYLATLQVLTDSAGRAAREWNWWEERREARERGRIMEVIRQWDHAAPPPGGYLSEQDIQARLRAVLARRLQAAEAEAARLRTQLAKIEAEGSGLPPTP